jgi:hypothetical protein
MLWPTVTELPRKLEPTTGDTFTQDLNARTVPRSEPASHLKPTRDTGLDADSSA